MTCASPMPLPVYGREFLLTIPGDPVAKARPRVYQGRAVTPKRTQLAEERIFAEFRRKYPDAVPIGGMVEVVLGFWMGRRGKPDWDNLAKLACDALNGLAYRDDAQIVRCAVNKFMPDRRVPGARPGSWRNRTGGDPCLWLGKEYEPHTMIHVLEIIEPAPGMVPDANSPEGDRS